MAIKRQLKTPSRSLLEGVLFSSTLILFPILIRILPNFGKKIHRQWKIFRYLHKTLPPPPFLANIAQPSFIKSIALSFKACIILFCAKHTGKLSRFKLRNIYAIDSSTIKLAHWCFQWAKHRQHKAAVKVHMVANVASRLPHFCVYGKANEHDSKKEEILLNR